MTGRRLAAVPTGQESARVWTLRFPDGTELLTANDRRHWREHARIVADLRETTGWLARYRKVPQLDRAHILAVYHPAVNRRRDRANWHPTVKAIVDGLVAVGVLPDDNDAHLEGPDIQIGQVAAKAHMVIVITERITP